MFVVRVELSIQETKREDLRAFVVSEAREARKLAGCKEYAFCEDIAEPLRVLLYEEWATRADFEAYRNSAIFTASGAHLRPLLSKPPRSAYYDSDDVFSTCALP